MSEIMGDFMSELAGFGRDIGRAALVCAALSLAACASTQTVNGALESPAPAAGIPSAERTAAIAEIRGKAERAKQDETEPDIYQSYAPPERPVKTSAEIRAIEAELKAIAAASGRASSSAELAALQKRAAYLEKLRSNQESGLDEDPSTGSINQ
jgi:hypothetical protein